MLRFLIALALLLVVGPAFGQSETLPEDADKYTIVVVDNATPSPGGVSLLSMLNNDPALRAIAEQCHRQKFTTQSPLYLQRYAASLPPTNLPVFAMVRGDGGVIYKASGAAIPAAKELAAELTKRAELDRGLRNSDGFEYKPTPAELVGGPFRDPTARPLDRVIPDSLSVNPTVSTDGLVPVAIVVGLVVLAVILGGIALFGVGCVAFVFLRR